MKGMFLKKCDIYYQKCATAAQRFQLSMTKLGACDGIRWNDGKWGDNRASVYCGGLWVAALAALAAMDDMCGRTATSSQVSGW
jgi:hypothetical protein